MKALSNIQGPMEGETLCFHEAALIFIGCNQETVFLNWGQGRRGLQLCLGTYTCPWRGLKKAGGAPTQAFGIRKFSVILKKNSKKPTAVFSRLLLLPGLHKCKLCRP